MFCLKVVTFCKFARNRIIHFSIRSASWRKFVRRVGENVSPHTPLDSPDNYRERRFNGFLSRTDDTDYTE